MDIQHSKSYNFTTNFFKQHFLKKKAQLTTLLLLLVFVMSCNSDKVYHEIYTFSDYQWSANEKVIFTPELSKENSDIDYRLVINLRYIHGFPYKYLHLMVKITEPDGTEANKKLSIQIVTDEKKYIGEGIGDYWDLDYPIKELIPFKKQGKYTIEIISMMEEKPVNFINEIGISLIKELKQID